VPADGVTTSVAVIGGAFSGICFAAHLHRLARGPLAVQVFERAGLGRSVAFGTREPVHLLNGPAGVHSAFDDAPEDFVEFLRQDAEAQRFVDASRPLHSQFVPRMLYGRYLRRLAERLTQPSPAGASVSFLHAEVRDILARHDGLGIVTSDGAMARADIAVLAVGHPAPRSLAARIGPRHLIDDPWDAGAVRAIPPDTPVTIVGSGQSAVDLVLAIAGHGHRAPITVLSRRGCIAQPYVFVERPYAADAARIPARLRPLVRWVRAEARRFAREGGDWRAVVNSLRPHTQRLWYGFSTAEKRRFLEHLAPFWYAHRSRLPPQVVRRLAELRAGGQVRILAGRIGAVTPAENGVVLHVRPRGASGTVALPAGAVVNCTGPRWDLERPQNPLIANLIARGAARWDDVGEGIAVTPGGAVLDASGCPAPRLFALGPICRGTLLEIVVARDVRTQCANLARRLLVEERTGTEVV
jgi:uncharacterized NAD(P)/FAD-binding protein YdhS